jgi:DNA-binding LytR/AlgR family response regulator
MKIVIIEDEAFAARRLGNLVKEYSSDIEISAWLESVHDSIEWFNNNPEPDLLFLDIHLEDNLSFAIFNKITISCPIVFTTATDELAVKAFMTKGIDFLHKPIVQTELNKMLDKYSSQDPSLKKEINAGFFDDLMNRK